MAHLSKKLRSAEGDRIHYWCPGCNEMHGIVVKKDGGSGWGWNGDVDRPTFTPSILTRAGHYAHDKGPGDCWCDYHIRYPEKAKNNRWKCVRCHCFITDGNIRFLNDCTHHLVGMTVPLPDFPGSQD